VVLAAGYGLFYYYSYLCKLKRIDFLEQTQALTAKVSAKVQTAWDKSLENTITHARRLVSGSPEQISKALKIIEASQNDIQRAFYIDNKIIYLPQWRKFRISKAREELDLGISENPEFKRAEFFEYQYNFYQEAVKIYEKFWLSNPDDFQAANALARCWYKSGDFDRAEKIYRQIHLQNPSIQRPGDVPLAVTAAFQLLNIYQSQQNQEQIKEFGYQLYRDLLDEKWELSQVKTDFFKLKTESVLNQYMEDENFAHKFDRLLARGKSLKKIKDYVRFISSRVIPLIESSYIHDYRIFFLASKTAFLLIIPHGEGYIVLDINYVQFVQNNLIGLIKTLAKDHGLGIKLSAGGVVHNFPEVSPGHKTVFSISKNFPDLKLELNLPDASAADMNSYLFKLRNVFFAGYGIFVVVLGFLFFLLIKQIQLAELKSDFVSHVSHELKTPLTSLRMFSEMLNRPLRLPVHKRRQYYEIMNKESIRLSRLIENLMDISRIEKKKTLFYFKTENLNTLLKTASEIFLNSIEKNQHPLRLELHSNVEIDMDKDAILQMILNILDNSKKFSREGDAIYLKSLVQENQVVIIIRDQGIGMSKSEIRKVFKKFYQVKKSYEDKFKGVGLGLAIVKNIVRAHHGSIILESEKGRGTTTRIFLPLKRT
jgi:two-component system phosphate regulon sensor histidine kinase PhoR